MNTFGFTRYGPVSSLEGVLDMNALHEDVPSKNCDIPDDLLCDIDDAFGMNKQKFGFQRDNAENQKEMLISWLISRHACVHSYEVALKAIHADVVSGENSNFQIWLSYSSYDAEKPIVGLSITEMIHDLSLYLLIWGEASNLRFCPEMLCFIFALARDSDVSDSPEGDFLERVIIPLYTFLTSQLFKQSGDSFVRRNRDHSSTIGYDDCNEMFWTMRTMKSLRLDTCNRLLDEPPAKRFGLLGSVCWSKFFQKQFYERRTGWHVFVNFLPIWLLHSQLFYASFCIRGGSAFVGNDPNMSRVLLGLIGVLSLLLVLFSSILEQCFVARSQRTFRPVCKAVILLLVNSVIPVVLLMFNILPYVVIETLSYAQVFVGVLTSIYTMIYPRLQSLDPIPFISSFASLPHKQRLLSMSMWATVFIFKAAASYIYLIDPFMLPLEKLINSSTSCKYLVCTVLNQILVGGLISLNFVLFLLDTYIWYIIATTCIGVFVCIKSGISGLTPWRQVYSALPERMKAKLPSTKHSSKSEAVASIWNNIVMSMVNDHLISKAQAEELKYQINPEDPSEIKSPMYFLQQEDSYAGLRKEAHRRSTFFSQSLSMAVPEALIDIPVFTVLIPQFSEKIMLSLRDIIGEYEGRRDGALTVLDYLKTLYADEWEYFVQDSLGMLGGNDEAGRHIALNALGFSRHDECEINRTRVWASLRSQTVFRTVSGFMNYRNAIQLLRGESQTHRFRMVLALQRYASMSVEDLQDVEFLFTCFPDIVVSYTDTLEGKHYSCLVSSDCELMANGRRKPRFKIQLPGAPILGDGKSDNQNQSIIFSRGEIIQLIDSNQDCYLEEALKIFNLLAEFNDEGRSPVAIVGAREYIFSERIGALGDNSAAKEYTFGTITQRVSTLLGGRLHYGHPDFLNSIFMFTRGGVSKGQKGLHLNEDIFAGMTAFMRNGRIKHTEYYQCGKGRDMGFSSILGFVFKIGSGMGEQMLSREQYYLGLYLPLDRLFTFFYTHPGFHMNNLWSFVSINVFVLCLFWTSLLDNCDSENSCTHLGLLYAWFSRSVIAIIVVMFIAYLPFVAQATIEFGITISLKRIMKQLLSLTPLFEVFTTQTYAYSVASIGWSLGGVGYVSTGRGFALARLPFKRLFASFKASLVNGSWMFTLLCCILIKSASRGSTAASMFFMVIAISLLISPVFFNPHQFRLADFLLDYKSLLQWYFSNDEDSWISFHQKTRMRFTGSIGDKETIRSVRSHKLVLIFHELLLSVASYILAALSYAYLSQSTILIALPFAFALSHVAIYMAIVGAQGLISTFFGQLLCGCSSVAGKTIAEWTSFIVKLIGIVVFVVFFFAMWMFSNWDFLEFTCLYVAYVFGCSMIQRFFWIVVLGKERKPKRVNFAWWSGRWAENVGIASLWLIFRELFAKSIETWMFAADLFTSHLVLFLCSAFLLIPHVDIYHTWLLYWTPLHGSKTMKLGAVIFTTSENRLRRRAARLYGCIYFSLFILTICLLAAPNIYRPPVFIHKSLLQLNIA